MSNDIDKSEQAEIDRITELHQSGCTLHCAKGQVWGGQPCVCPGDGTGSPYHSMNPPPGGWPKPKPVDIGMTQGHAFKRLRRAAGMTMMDAARALDISPAHISKIERDLVLPPKG